MADDPEAAESLIGATDKTPRDTALSYVATARVALRAYETPAAVTSTTLLPQVDRDALPDSCRHAEVALSGISDRRMLEYLSGLLGDEQIRQRSTSGRASQLSESETWRPLATVDELRWLPPDRAVLVHTST
ncbi:MAG: TraM recognition domain-containing protein [Actinobacteria bacterium]|nr:TraM recognition domain-containing protein [Actinomycetota bacterium]